jgi:alpha-glucosidase (family GH31 glycosyl hydrolase)
VLFLNSAAQELSLTPAPAAIFRTIGGILDIYFFLGPEPDDTNRQYTEAIGRYPLPPYWSLGFHLSRWGYDTLENMQATVERNAAYDIPHDAQWGDIDIMERALDFTISEENFGGLPEYVQELKIRGIKFVTILDPCISIGETNYRPFDLGDGCVDKRS